MVRVRRRGEALLLTHGEIKICLTLFAVFLTRDVHGEEINCQNLQRVTNQVSLTVPIPPTSQPDSPPVILWYEPDASDQANASLGLKFGKYEFAVENAKRSWKLSLKVSKRKVMESRVYYEWIIPQGWASITLSSSRSGYGIEIGPDQALDIHLGGLEMDTIDAIEISGASITISTACNNTKERQRISSTTLPPTQTTTTTAATTSTTTEPPTTEPDTTTISPDYETTIEEDTDVNDSTLDPDPDIVLPFASKEALDGYECTDLPIWVWVCASAMVAFFALSLILFVCVIILYRRNKSLLGSSDNESKPGNVLPGRLVSSGGYGQQSKDLQFVTPGNNDSIVAIAPPQPSLASYTQTLNMSSGNQMAPNVRFSTGPRPCEYKRSTSCPERSPSISFPPPPATPPPERNETVPLFSPDGSVENNRTFSGRGRRSLRTSSARRKRHVRECIEADDESSTDN
ncbi:uncharacterized protein [Macrobrachium rosenbergii]|uniref:uncharacterized protein n=1 Tax=Macrobrachium rosenbergii TaxID=79674 RepID=UPI0034D65280